MEEIHKKIISIVTVIIIVVAALVPVINMATHATGDYVDEIRRNEDPSYYLKDFDPNENLPYRLMSGPAYSVTDTGVATNVTPSGVSFVDIYGTYQGGLYALSTDGKIYNSDGVATSPADVALCEPSNVTFTKLTEDGKTALSADGKLYRTVGVHTYGLFAESSHFFVDVARTFNSDLMLAIDNNGKVFTYVNYSWVDLTPTGKIFDRVVCGGYSGYAVSTDGRLYELNSNILVDRTPDGVTFKNAILPTSVGTDFVVSDDGDIYKISGGAQLISFTKKFKQVIAPIISDDFFAISQDGYGYLLDQYGAMRLIGDLTILQISLYSSVNSQCYALSTNGNLYKIINNGTDLSYQNITPSGMSFYKMSDNAFGSGAVALGGNPQPNFNFNISADYPSADFSVYEASSGTTTHSSAPVISLPQNSTWSITQSGRTQTITLNDNNGNLAYRVSATIPGGYTFNQWSVGATGTITTDVNATLSTTKDVYTITLNPNGGTVDPNSIQYSVDTASVTLPTPTKTGTIFQKWQTGALEFSAGVLNNPYTVFGGTSATLTARYENIEYAISLDPNGGSVSPISVKFLVDTTSVTLPTPTKAGHSFQGWLYDGETYPAGTLNNPFAEFGGNVTLTAQYDVEEYTITLDAGSGSVTPTTISYDITTASVTLPTASRTGYTFLDWMNGGATYPAGTLNNPYAVFGGNVTLTAQYDANEYTITFDTDGGDYVAPITFTADSGSITLPTTIKDGYTFTDWYNSTYGHLSGSINPFTIFGANNVTLTAQYTMDTYTITLNSDGGGAFAPITYNVETLSVTLPTPSKSAYVFQYWSDANDNHYSPGTLAMPWMAFHGNVTLTAIYSYDGKSVELNPNGGTITGGTTSIPFDVATPSITLPSAVRTGYNFSNWKNLDTGRTYSAGVLNNPYTEFGGESVNLTAVWQMITYTVTFVVPGGTPPTPVQFNDGDQTVTLPSVTKPGYTFLYWTDANDNHYNAGEINAFTTFGANSLSLTAEFEANVYTITFDTQGGQTIADMTYTIETDYVLIPVGVKEGYTFDIWNSSKGQIPVGRLDAPYNVFGGDITLTATYILDHYTIAFDTQGGTPIASLDYTIDTASVVIPTASKDGYQFINWTETTIGTISAGTVNNPYVFFGARSVTLVSDYDIIELTLTLDPNGGTIVGGSPSTITVTVLTPYVDLPECTAEGKTFKSWYNSERGFITDDRINDPYHWMNGGDVLLVCQYDLINYTITFNPGTGTVTPTSVTYTIGDDVQILLPTPTLDRHRFDYWEFNSVKIGAVMISNPYQFIYNQFGVRELTLTAHFTQNVFTFRIVGDWADPTFKVMNVESGTTTYETSPALDVMLNWRWETAQDGTANLIRIYDGSTMKYIITLETYPEGYKFDHWSIAETGTITSDMTATAYVAEMEFYIGIRDNTFVADGFDIDGYTVDRPFLMVADEFAFKFDGAKMTAYFFSDGSIRDLVNGDILSIKPFTHTWVLTDRNGSYTEILIPSNIIDPAVKKAVYESTDVPLYITKENDMEIINDDGVSKGTADNLTVLAGTGSTVTYDEYMRKSFEVSEIDGGSSNTFVLAPVNYTVSIWQTWSPSFDAVAAAIPLMVVVALLVGVIIYMKKKNADAEE